jgi:aminocarboxymuconate-semialdehyde decarboxylase
LPVEQIMLGSDAPFPLGEPHPVTFVRNALPAEQAKLVLEDNFERLTGG